MLDVWEAGDPDRPLLVMCMGSATGVGAPDRAAYGPRLVPDLPGYRASPGPFTFDGAVAGLRELIGPRRESVCGLSAGATLVLRLAAEYTGRVASCTAEAAGPTSVSDHGTDPEVRGRHETGLSRGVLVVELCGLCLVWAGLWWAESRGLVSRLGGALVG